MNNIGWTAVAIRLMAMWLALDILIGVPGFLANWWSTIEFDFGEQAGLMRSSVTANIVALVTTGFVSLTLWFQSDFIARYVWRNQPLPEAKIHNVTPSDLQQSVFMAAGLLLIVHGLPNLTELAAGYYSLPAGVDMERHYTGDMKARAVGVAVQIAVGVLVIVRPDKLSQMIETVRSRSARPIEDLNEQ